MQRSQNNTCTSDNPRRWITNYQVGEPISEVIDLDSWEQIKWEQVKAEVVQVEIEEGYTKSQGTYYSIKPLFSFRLIDGTMHSAKFENLSFRKAEDYGAA